jgi:hypothetical protein
MSLEMKNIINDLRMFQSYITVKLLNKFKNTSNYNFDSEDEWGWFIDPEINNNKPFILKHFSTLTTIQEENITKEITKISSIKSIHHFNNELKQVHYESNHNYIAIVGLTTLFSLIYIFMIL